MSIPFNRPHMTGRELAYITQAHAAGHLAGDGHFTRACSAWLEGTTHARRALLTHSCTAALEMAAILANIGPGDEVIMPSFTFVSTANAFVLRGGVPVFVDIRDDTLNLDERLLEAAITPRTKAIVPVHYAGVGCEMDALMAIAKRHGHLVIEDAAQGLMSRFRDRPLGGIGHMATLSFHETKNITCGEGGALLINDDALVERAEVIREKGTNRSQFFRGEVDKYTWVDIGSSFLPGEMAAAFLLAQTEAAHSITAQRLALWQHYHQRLRGAHDAGLLRQPHVPAHCQHNAHMYYVLLPSLAERTRVMAGMKAAGMGCVFHYVPLHSAPGAQGRSRAVGAMTVTDDVSARLLRLPMWLGLAPQQDAVIDQLLELLGVAA